MTWLLLNLLGPAFNVCVYRLWLRLLRVWGLPRRLQRTIFWWLLPLWRLLFRLHVSSRCQRSSWQNAIGTVTITAMKAIFNFSTFIFFYFFFSYRNKLLFAQHTLFHNKIKSKLKHHNFYKFLIYQDNQNAITNCVPMSVPGGCTFTEVYLYMRYAT